MSGVDVLAVLTRDAEHAAAYRLEHGYADGSLMEPIHEAAEARSAVSELIEAAEQAKRAYWLARNSAAGLTNFCEESASVRRCERELSEAEAIWLNAGVDAALARVQGGQP